MGQRLTVVVKPRLRRHLEQPRQRRLIVNASVELQRRPRHLLQLKQRPLYIASSVRRRQQIKRGIFRHSLVVYDHLGQQQQLISDTRRNLTSLTNDGYISRRYGSPDDYPIVISQGVETGIKLGALTKLVAVTLYHPLPFELDGFYYYFHV
nr:hypothetical protein HmN_000850800 [Hymenolepis microstoma]